MTTTRKQNLQTRHKRLRKKLVGNSARPRLAVHFSGKHIYAQIIDDFSGCTLASVSTTEEIFRSTQARANIVTAVAVGKLMAERAKSIQLSRVVFDRGGFNFHGKVKALADAARDGGLEF